MMRKANQMMCKTIEARVGAFLAGMLLSFVVLAADAPSAPPSLVVPKGEEARNPTTDIAVGFGDVSHLSPWRIKRRFARTGGNPRGGQPVKLRDALLAVNEFVAKDEEMPEHTFTFAEDGTLTSICDVPITQVSLAFDGTVRPFAAALLDEPVRDFAKVEFQKAGAARKAAPGPVAVAQGKADSTEEASDERRSGTSKSPIICF